MGKLINSKIEHPGLFIREEIEARRWTQRDLAYILGRPEQAINMIISGKRGISVDMARAFEEVFDVPAEFFINLQRMYDLSQAKEPDTSIARRARFFKSSYPVREMIRRGWLEDTDTILLEAQMSRFFEVNKVDEIPQLAHAAKKTYYESIPSEQLAWLFRVRQLAKSIEVPHYSEKKLRGSLIQMKTLMSDRKEVRHVPRILMDCGVRYILVERLPCSKIDGVCFWLNSTSPVIGMSLRYDRIDNFWFVLAHEIEHVIKKDGMKKEIIDTELLENEKAFVSEEEKNANAKASDFCVSRKEIDSFIARKYPYISERDLLGFAKKLGIHPGIVVGQLHYKTKEYKYFRKHLVKIRDYLLPSALVDGWGEIAPASL